MEPGLRHRLAEKMAGEITLSDSPGKTLKKWRMSFDISQGHLSEFLGVSPSVISDYESGRRKSPGTAIIGRIVDSILAIDEGRGGRYIQKFASLLFAEMGEGVIYDLHDYSNQITLETFCRVIGGELLTGPTDLTIYGYTIIDSIKAIMNLSSNEFNRIYGWSTERALIFTGVSNGKSPMVAIRVTPFKPRCVVLHGISAGEVHPIVPKMAEKDHITLMCTEKDIEEIVENLRDEKW
ncbi:MAG TPA: helix-turn-helix domain-containing protein [Methanospirillum sp.]|uniref:helix-turn-helix domain-containing protein n=1 Tax=Methanospirillum sp. TaxID=45200 RepID=UPI002C1095ED|nr:helix-turn-helix domain-containing protein [Methanospirillum sp.]HWQ64847.1 helix-turn-helix domain-containing protein [Methanospirillum sp.]